MKLISLIPLHLREAEGDEQEQTPTGDEGDTENPFATTDDAGEGGGEEAADADTPEGGEDGAEGEEDQKSLEITFDQSKVRKYNDQPFKDPKGTVIGVSRFGVTVKLPDEKTIFVNFEDIL